MSESNKDFRSLFELCANLAPLQWHRMIWNTVGRGPFIKDVGKLEGRRVTIPPVYWGKKAGLILFNLKVHKPSYDFSFS